MGELMLQLLNPLPGSCSSEPILVKSSVLYAKCVCCVMSLSIACDQVIILKRVGLDCA